MRRHLRVARTALLAADLELLNALPAAPRKLHARSQSAWHRKLAALCRSAGDIEARADCEVFQLQQRTGDVQAMRQDWVNSKTREERRDASSADDTAPATGTARLRGALISPKAREKTALLRRFWGWVAAFPPDAAPAGDTSGARCALYQVGDTWFLAGNAGGGAVTRTCVIPAGKRIFVPLLAYGNADPADASCSDRRLGMHLQFGTATRLHLIVDGRPVFSSPPSLQTDCIDLPSSQGPVPYGIAAFWALLRPLPPGPHRVEYGARAPNVGLQQTIVYNLFVE
jgi:hypothetical protein